MNNFPKFKQVLRPDKIPACLVGLTLTTSTLPIKISGLFFAALFLWSVGHCWVRLRSITRPMILWGLVVLSPLLLQAILVSWREHGASSVFLVPWIALPFMVLCLRDTGSMERALILGCCLGCALGFIQALAAVLVDPTVRAAPRNMNALLFASLSLLMASISMSMYWLHRCTFPRALGFLAAFGGFLGAGGAVLSGSKTAIGCIVVLFAAFMVSAWSNKRYVHKRSMFAGLVLTIGLIGGLVVSPLGARLAQSVSETKDWFSDSERHTSAAARLDLVKVTGVLMTEHSILGIGAKEFASKVHVLRADGVVRQVLPDYQHPHMTVLSILVDGGLVGLFSWCLALWLIFQQFGQGPRAWIGRLLLIQVAALSLGTDLLAHQSSIRMLVLLLAVSIAIGSNSFVTKKPLQAVPS
jgi:hypothetical protein